MIKRQEINHVVYTYISIKCDTCFDILFILEMEFKKQEVELTVENLDELIENKNKKRKYRHSTLLPNSIRCLICGPSNCGKTNVILSLLTKPNGLRFENVYIYSHSLFQPKYQYLKRIFESLPDIGCYMFANNDSVIEPEESKNNSIFIFDDVVCDKQNNVKKFFCMGRHKNVDCFYLSQSYTKIPKHLVRENSNFIILFKQDEMNLKHIYSDFSIGADMSFSDFLKMCNNCWKSQYDFLVIDIERRIDNGKYRKGFDTFIHIQINSN